MTVQCGPGCTLPAYQVALYSTELARLQALLPQLDAAITAFMLNPITQYSLSTGQTQQTVTRASLPGLNAWRASVWSQILDISRLLNCDSGAVVYVRPGY